VKKTNWLDRSDSIDSKCDASVCMRLSSTVRRFVDFQQLGLCRAQIDFVLLFANVWAPESKLRRNPHPFEGVCKSLEKKNKTAPRSGIDWLDTNSRVQFTGKWLQFQVAGPSSHSLARGMEQYGADAATLWQLHYCRYRKVERAKSPRWDSWHLFRMTEKVLSYLGRSCHVSAKRPIGCTEASVTWGPFHQSCAVELNSFWWLTVVN
jgi:hypothetical protein